jgi:hypothetical protein
MTIATDLGFVVGKKYKCVGVSNDGDPFVVGNYYTLHEDDNSNCPSFLGDDDDWHYMWIAGSDPVEFVPEEEPTKEDIIMTSDSVKNPSSVYRIKFLYQDGTEYNVGGVTNFVMDSKDSQGVPCFEYTKTLNNDVESTYFVKKVDMAALILRHGGLTNVYTFTDDVVQTVDVRLKRPSKGVNGLGVEASDEPSDEPLTVFRDGDVVVIKPNYDEIDLNKTCAHVRWLIGEVNQGYMHLDMKYIVVGISKDKSIKVKVGGDSSLWFNPNQFEKVVG